jgi:glyoxalase family protein
LIAVAIGDHQRWRSLLLEEGYYPAEILDRNYFKALYFHEEGGILFEIATDPQVLRSMNLLMN